MMRDDKGEVILLQRALPYDDLDGVITHVEPGAVDVVVTAEENTQDRDGHREPTGRTYDVRFVRHHDNAEDRDGRAIFVEAH